MKILVCFKIVPDTDLLTQEEWQQAVAEKMDFTFQKKILGCFDEAALEMGLRLADQVKNTDNPAQLTAVTVGGNGPDAMLKSLFAVGYSRVVRLETSLDLAYSPLATAQLLAQFVRENGGYDLILMGQQTVGGDNGQTHWLLGELLGLPCRSQVETDELPETIPAVWAVENSQHPYLRMATLREKLAAGKMTVESIPVETEAPLYEPTKIWREDRRRHCQMIEGENAPQKAAALYAVLQEVLKA